MTDFRAITALLALACALIGGCGGGATAPAAPAVRDGLYFGYYGAAPPAQLAPTAGHTNLLFDLALFGVDSQLANVESMRLPTVLGVTPEMWLDWTGDKRTAVLNPAAESALRDLFYRMRARGILQYVVALYPCDEPDLTIADYADIDAATALLRRVAAEFDELTGVKLAVFYPAGSHYPGIASFDWIGVDDYGARADVLTSEYQRLLAQLRPDQRTMLIPAGAGDWMQDPAQFVNFAESHPEVVAVVPFIWFDDPGMNMPGIRSDGMAPIYCAAGARITGKSADCSIFNSPVQ